MPPRRQRGLSPRTPDLENNDACWRAETARQRASYYKPGFQGAQPLWPPESILPLCFLTFTQLSLVADDCKSSSSNPRTPSSNPFAATGARPFPDKDPKLCLGHAPKPATPKPAPGLAESGCAQEKLNFIFLEEGKMPPAAWGLSPGPPTWKTMTPVGARAPTGVIVFPKRVSKGAQPLWPPEAFFLFAS